MALSTEEIPAETIDPDPIPEAIAASGFCLVEQMQLLFMAAIICVPSMWTDLQIFQETSV